MRENALATAKQEEHEASPEIHLKGLEAYAINGQAAPSTISEEPLEAEDETEAPMEKKSKRPDSVFGDLFIVDTMEVPNAKIIPQVIRGVALDLFPDNDQHRSNDYYYAYTYNDCKLAFAIVKSKAYVAGKVPGFLPTLLTPGRYAYQHGSQHYVIEHDLEGNVTSKVYQEPQAECTNIEDALEKLDGTKIPPTLQLQWSLTSNYKPVTLIMLLVFLGVLGAYFFSLRGYQDIVQQSAHTASVSPFSITPGLPPIGELIKTVANTTAPKGAIIKLIKKADKTNLAFAVEFQNENDTREFITHQGGRYEDGKVIFAFDLAGPGQPGLGRSDRTGS